MKETLGKKEAMGHADDIEIKDGIDIEERECEKCCRHIFCPECMRCYNMECTAAGDLTCCYYNWIKFQLREFRRKLTENEFAGWNKDFEINKHKVGGYYIKISKGMKLFTITTMGKKSRVKTLEEALEIARKILCDYYGIDVDDEDF